MRPITGVRSGSLVDCELRSEVDDEITGRDDRPISGRCYSGVGVTIERIRINRAIIADLRTNLDLRREPVLPAQSRIGITSLDAGALSLHVVEKFGAKGKVVQLVRRIIDVQKKRLCVGSACQRGGAIALRRVRGVEGSVN